MSKKQTNHIHHYFSLFGLLGVATIGMIVFAYDRNFQNAIAVSAAIGYFAWGIIHHSIHKDLQPVIILEYLMISLLGLVVLLSLIVRS